MPATDLICELATNYLILTNHTILWAYHRSWTVIFLEVHGSLIRKRWMPFWNMLEIKIWAAVMGRSISGYVRRIQASNRMLSSTSWQAERYWYVKKSSQFRIFRLPMGYYTGGWFKWDAEAIFLMFRPQSWSVHEPRSGVGRTATCSWGNTKGAWRSGGNAICCWNFGVTNQPGAADQRSETGDAYYVDVQGCAAASLHP